MNNNIKVKYLGFINQVTNLENQFESQMTDSSKERMVELAHFIFEAMKKETS